MRRDPAIALCVIGQSDLVKWDEAQMTKFPAGMWRYLALSRGDRTARAKAEEHWWTMDAVLDEGSRRRRNR